MAKSPMPFPMSDTPPGGKGRAKGGKNPPQFQPKKSGGKGKRGC